MTVGLTPKRDLFLITGIPGTGKTSYGNELSRQFGFAHYDLEDCAFSADALAGCGGAF